MDTCYVLLSCVTRDPDLIHYPQSYTSYQCGYSKYLTKLYSLNRLASVELSEKNEKGGVGRFKEKLR
jgi:hypothetical protein